MAVAKSLSPPRQISGQEQILSQLKGGQLPIVYLSQDLYGLAQLQDVLDIVVLLLMMGGLFQEANLMLIDVNQK